MNRWVRWGVAIGLLVVGTRWIPVTWCSREANAWYGGSPRHVEQLAGGVMQWVIEDLGREDFVTGSDLFNGEWLFGTYVMAGLGLGQTSVLVPEQAESYQTAMAVCIDAILADEVRAFDAERWRSDPIEDLGGPNHHAAYLGYFNLLLGMHRFLDPASPYADLHDRITDHLVSRLDESPIGLLETYPGEFYPVDNAAVLGSIGLHDRSSGGSRKEWLANEWADYRERYVDEESGLLIQAVSAEGAALDLPRGSGTSLAVYFLGFADPAWSRELYEALDRELAGSWLGFGAVREYRRGVHGYGDVDSGPVIFGWSFSATGFSIAGARMHGDQERFRRLFASAWLAGAPLDRDGVRRYVSGGPLGNAILLAMFTAPAGGEL